MNRSGTLERKTPLRRAGRRAWRPQVEGEAFWSIVRELVLERAGGRCQSTAYGHRCTDPATDVDHIIPLGMGGSRYDPLNERNRASNLQALCRDCHSAKTLSVRPTP